MTTTHTTVTKETIPLTHPLPKSGEIWRDARRHNIQRLFLVLDVNQDKATCQSLLTRKVSRARLGQFNRGKTGFFHAGDLHAANRMFLSYESRPLATSQLNAFTKDSSLTTK